MKQYLDLLNKVLTEGKRKTNRTGIDTISISGAMLEFDMSTGKFPLLTTKKMGLKTIFSELEMFIKGITSKKFLQDRNSHIWDAWCNPQKVPYSTDPEQQKLMEKEDDLGPIYGFNGNYWDAGQDNYIPVERRLITPVPEKYENVWDSAIFAATYAVKERAVAESQWFVKLYGERIFNRLLDIYEKLLRTDTILPVSWVLVSNFLKDCTKMPGWVGFLRNPDTYVLDNTYYGSNGYSVDTCVWISIDEQDHYRMMDRGNFSNTLQRFPLPINQLQNVINTLQTDPTSRRMVVSYWNPQLMNQMALPPCHYCYEFLSDGESVDLLFNMRSVDCFLGMPFDIAHYAMLLLLICKQVNMKPGKLIGFFADTHIYVNHLDQVKEQLSRTPFESPSVEILNANDPKWTIWDWSYTDFELHDYQCHPAIKAPVAV
jgi:thymidylate synthase